jgi:hypothetical protein
MKQLIRKALKVLGLYNVVRSYLLTKVNWDEISFENGDADLIHIDHKRDGDWYCIEFSKIKQRWMIDYV